TDIGGEHEDQDSLRLTVGQKLIGHGPKWLVRCREIRCIRIGRPGRTVPGRSVQSIHEGQVSITIKWRMTTPRVVVDDMKFDCAESMHYGVIDKCPIIVCIKRGHEPCRSTHDWERNSILIHQVAVVGTVAHRKNDRIQRKWSRFYIRLGRAR